MWSSRTLACIAAWAALAPGASAAGERTLRLGATLQFGLPGVAQRVRVRVDAIPGETLTLVAESHQCDVELRIEDAQGALLAGDDDSGIETNASIFWTPREGQELFLSVASKPPSTGMVGVRAFRGSVTPLPPDEPAAARAYWETALFRARNNRDAARVALALGELVRLTGLASADEVVAERAERDVWAQRLIAYATAAKPDVLRTAAGRAELAGLVAATCELLEARDDAVLLLCLNGLASLCNQAGDLRAERRALERCAASMQRIRPAHHPDRILPLQNLAVTVGNCGEWERNLELDREVLAVLERTCAATDELLIKVRLNTAFALIHLGDVASAFALAEPTLAVCEASFPADDLQTARAREALACCCSVLGDLENERALLEQVVAARTKHLPADDDDLWRARVNLAFAIDDLEGGHRAMAEVHGHLENSLALFPPDHPFVLENRMLLATVSAEAGELVSAKAQVEELLAAAEGYLDEGHPELQFDRHALAELLARLGDAQDLGCVLESMARGALWRMATSIALSSRERRAWARATARDLSFVLALRPVCSASGELDLRLFEWIETRRAIASLADSGLGVLMDDDRFRSLRTAWQVARERVGDLLAATSSVRSQLDAAELLRAASERDRLERELVELSARERPAVTVAAVAAALAPGTFAVSFARCRRLAEPPCAERRLRSEAAYLAHVIGPDGELARVELGGAATIEAAIERWLRALTTDGADGERRLGQELRELVLDPVLARCGAARTLKVCLDAELLRVPLEALPLDDARVGDRLRLLHVTSLAPMPGSAHDPHEPRSLACIGNPDFDAVLAASASIDALVPAEAVALARGTAGASGFAPLANAEPEIRGVAQLFAEHVAPRALVLSGSGATERALREAVAGRSFVHVATHAYFSDFARGAEQGERWRVGDRVHELSPLALCGLALAGANLGPSEDGRHAGILTAEELATLDLSRCELVVLAACSTQVGIRAPGEGVASLHAAAHAAGARSVLTSLWKVDDRAARELMLDFYRLLWVEGRPKAQALWEAKVELRSKRYRVVDWAGWVLTGDPD